MSHMFSLGFCFELPVFDDGLVTQVTFSRNTTRGGIWRMITGERFIIFPDTAKLQPNSLGYFGNKESFDRLFINQDYRGNYFVRITYLLQSTVVGRRGSAQCYNYSTPAECIGSCIIAKIINKRNCFPFTFDTNPEGSPFEHLPYCNYNSSSNTNMCFCESICKKKCVVPCEYKSYQWHVTWFVRDDAVGKILSVEVLEVDSPYVQFNITAKQTYQQFIASVFGILNLFLGVSGLTAIGILVRLIDICGKRCKRKMSLDVSRTDGMQSQNEKQALKREIADMVQAQLDAKLLEIKQLIEQKKY